MTIMMMTMTMARMRMMMMTMMMMMMTMTMIMMMTMMIILLPENGGTLAEKDGFVIDMYCLLSCKSEQRKINQLGI